MHRLLAVAQIVSRNCSVDEPRGGGRWASAFVEFLIRTDVEHQHALEPQRTAGDLDKPCRIRGDCPRSDEVKAVAEVERLRAGTFDPNTLQAHFDRRLAQEGRALATSLDQGHLRIKRRRDHEARKSCAAADIQNAMSTAQPQDLRADRERDRDDAIEDVEYDLV